jgi:CYTH domain-containing protein
MNELERTFLAKFLPDGLKRCRSIEIVDIYIPKSVVHPKIRIRKIGNRFELTKKTPVCEGDSSHQVEQTIDLTEHEFNELSKLGGKVLHKTRYFYDRGGRVAEFGVYEGSLKGLVLIDFEFKTAKTKNKFRMPSFCLADVTQEEFCAGGSLSGKRYADIAKYLKKFGYRKIPFK